VIIIGIGTSYKQEVLLCNQRGFNSTRRIVSTLDVAELQWCLKVFHPVTQFFLFCTGKQEKFSIPYIAIIITWVSSSFPPL
jgi:hypothetical protein